MKGNLNTIVKENALVLVDFTAEWCGPCKMQSPILKEVSGEVSEKARIIKIDIDKNPTIASLYKVNGVPTLILFKNGEPVWRQSGVAGKQQLIDLIDQHANGN